MAEDLSRLNDLPLPELGGLTLTQARALSSALTAALAQVKTALKGAEVRYSAKERGIKLAQAAMDADEEAAFQATFNAADSAKGMLSDLADRDHGSDSDVFESDLQRARVEVYKVLLAAGNEASDFGTSLSDTAASTALLAREVETDTYALLKGLARVNGKVRSALVPATDYYRRRVVRRIKGEPTSQE